MELTPETFLAGIQMIQQQLRIKRDDHWSTAVCKLKYASFRGEFPEVNDPQFFWACEQWIQQFSAKDFATMPTWRELMVPLYATENGQANRSWGFKPDLPDHLRPSETQLALLPSEGQSIAGAADPLNPGAYEVVITPEGEKHYLLPEIPMSRDQLTSEQWAKYLRELEQEVNGATN